MSPTHEIKTAEELTAIYGDLRRARILELLTQEALSVKQLAKLINESPQTTHYHTKRLEEAGLIKVVRKREVRGAVEKFYRAVAERFVLTRSLGEAAAKGGVVDLGSAVEMAHSLLLSSAYYVAETVDPPHSWLAIGTGPMDSEAAQTLDKPMAALYKQFEETRDPEATPKYALVVALVPLDPDYALPTSMDGLVRPADETAKTE
jgi:DNA-binding transcriptional ArsR family regulator